MQCSKRKNQSTNVEYVKYLCVLLLLNYSFPFPSWLHRFEIDIEPIFATMALYDLKEKKKVRKLCFTVVLTVSKVVLMVLLMLTKSML